MFPFSLPLQFPLGRRAPCDIYWHGVSFHDSEHIVSGQVNKFPGISQLLEPPLDVEHLKGMDVFQAAVLHVCSVFSDHNSRDLVKP